MAAAGGRLEGRRGLLLLEDGIVAQTLALRLLTVVARGMCLVTLETAKRQAGSAHKGRQHTSVTIRAAVAGGAGWGGGGRLDWVALILVWCWCWTWFSDDRERDGTGRSFGGGATTPSPIRRVPTRARDKDGSSSCLPPLLACRIAPGRDGLHGTRFKRRTEREKRERKNKKTGQNKTRAEGLQKPQEKDKKSPRQVGR